ncbi:MAG: choice-of-anchor D domain-containing protein [Deltaproteobacteria bacterium]|nr:choice-of-anchor D domain-containing protein [Deltaproteobacteria bacterium]
MVVSSRHLVASVLASLASLAAFASPARADVAAPPSGGSAGNVSIGTAPSLKAELKSQLPTTIDSGWMDKGLIKVRTRFTIDPVGSDPLAAVDMSKGALVQASWNEKGFVNVKPVTGQDAAGAFAVRYTLAPTLDASIYGISVSYNANQLVNKIPGAKFNYDAKNSKTFLPWGFAGVDVKMTAPPLDSSTIFSIPFRDLGVSTGIAEGKLSIQAAAAPTFKFITKEIRLDGTTIAGDTTAKMPIGDQDALDLSAYVSGELQMSGNLDVKPVVQVDSVDGYPTFGLVKFSFSAVSKPIGGAPVPMAFANTTIHIPLPNLKVPSAGVQLGSVKAGSTNKKSISLENTGELEARYTVTSSDPRFKGPAGEIKIAPKSKGDLEITFNPENDGAASATITVKSNDPDSPEQTFKVGANGAAVEDESDDGTGSSGKGKVGTRDLDPLPEEGGCSTTGAGTHTSSGLAGLALGLGLFVAARRRRTNMR